MVAQMDRGWCVRSIRLPQESDDVQIPVAIPISRAISETRLPTWYVEANARATRILERK